MSLSPATLRQIPLFAEITDEHLHELISALQPRQLAVGELLFEAGSLPNRFLILVDGEVAIREGEQERFRLKPVAPVGELAAVTGMRRQLTAVAATPITLLTLPVGQLMQFFEEHGDVGFPFHYNLLRVVANKVHRDERRLDEMRHNIITTQKALKRMRQALLDSEDTPVHAQLFEQIDALIEQNKKGHYLVEPNPALRTEVHHDDGSVGRVRALSNEWLHIDARELEAGQQWSGVLAVAETEMPVSGTVDHVEEGVAAIDLDPLIEQYARALEDHLTRLQMLDVVL